MKIIKAFLQPFCLLLLTVFVLVHTDKAKTKIIGVRVDDKFGCAEEQKKVLRRFVTEIRRKKLKTEIRN